MRIEKDSFYNKESLQCYNPKVSNVEYTKERLNLLLKLYDINENMSYTTDELAKVLNISLQALINQKIFLINSRILVDVGIEQRRHYVKGYVRSYDAQLYSVDKRAIDRTIFRTWDKTTYLYDRAHLYKTRDEITALNR